MRVWGIIRLHVCVRGTQSHRAGPAAAHDVATAAHARATSPRGRCAAWPRQRHPIALQTLRAFKQLFQKQRPGRSLSAAGDARGTRRARARAAARIPCGWRVHKTRGLSAREIKTGEELNWFGLATSFSPKETLHEEALWSGAENKKISFNKPLPLLPMPE